MREITDVREVQAILNAALVYFADFCENNGLRYFLANGTLIGAVKYEKFVPWDDDVDILMPRNDYQKLLELTSVSNGTYRLLSKQTTPTWKMPYAKLTDSRTLLQEGDFDFGVELGVSLDIFPIDNWFSNQTMASVQAIYSDVLKRMLICSNGGEFHTEKRGIQKAILYSIWWLGKKLGCERIYQLIQKNAAAVKESSYCGCVAWTCHAQHEVLPNEVFASCEKRTFCGREYPIPCGYERYLDQLYGRWREELPLEKQKSNHVIKVWQKDERI